MTEMMKLALAQSEYATKARRWLHEHAELSMQEHETTAFLKKELAAMGAEILDLPLKTGVVAVIRGRGPGKNVVTGLRADIDALPIEEKTGKPYASRTAGVMHACGHDGHTAILLGTARALLTMRDRFSGMVKLIFQPAEENLGGAQAVIRCGALENPPLDSIAMLHGWPYFQVGDVGSWEGQYMASSDEFEIRVTGKSGHGCRPYKAVNPITAGAQIISAIQNIVASELVTSEQAVVSVCTIHAGSAHNIIPEQAVIGGTVRCLNPAVQQEIKSRLERTCTGIAAAMGCACDFDYTFGVPSLQNDPPVVRALLDAAQTALGPEHVKPLDGPVMGGEDFSFLRNAVGQGALLRLGLGDGAEELTLHNDHFDFNDGAIPTGIAVWLQYILQTNQ